MRGVAADSVDTAAVEQVLRVGIEAFGPIQFVALYPGFTYTDALNPSDVPLKGLIISKERAVVEMIWAIEKGKAKHMFPKRIEWLIALGLAIAAPNLRALLRWNTD